MPYATQADLETRFGAAELERLTDRDGTAGGVVAAVVAAALARAEAEIDGYIASRVTLPLDPVPGTVGAWTCELARYYLHEDRVPDTVRQRYEDVMARLKDVAAGRLSLGQGGGAATDPLSAGPVLIEAPERALTRDSLKNW